PKKPAHTTGKRPLAVVLPHLWFNPIALKSGKSEQGKRPFNQYRRLAVCLSQGRLPSFSSLSSFLSTSAQR
ncbi:hypothetical protein, partial [Hafnia sp.]|uniref:hypothetical protein n=1 Tax=Hafnia sp. TaxID=1873498 RepID=UPI002FCCA310